jgi:hypothetical protein
MVEDRVIHVDDLAVSITWKRMKNIRLRIIPPGGKVVVSAPLGLPPGRISRFVREQRPWIDQKREQLREMALDADRFEDGGRARLWGRWYDVEHERGNRACAWVAGHRLIIAGAGEVARERAIARFRRSEMERVSQPLLDSWVPVMGVPRPALIRYRAMRTRWGSCNRRTGAITLNTALVRFPVAALEYVVVHELAHLKHAGHGQGFWSLVAAAIPDHLERRRRLNAYTM